MSGHKKQKAIRQALCAVLSVLCILALAACGKTGEAQQGAASKDSISVQGAFILIRQTI